MTEFFELDERATNDRIAVLTDDQGFVPTMMSAGEGAGAKSPSHLGFYLDDRTAVDDLHRRFREAEFDPMDPQVQHGRCGFSVEAPADSPWKSGHEQGDRPR